MQIPDPTSPYPTSIPCHCLGAAAPPLEPPLPVSAVPVTCASEPRLSLVTEGMRDLSYHLTNNPAEGVGDGAAPLFFSNQVSK